MGDLAASSFSSIASEKNIYESDLPNTRKPSTAQAELTSSLDEPTEPLLHFGQEAEKHRVWQRSQPGDKPTLCIDAI